MPVSFPIPRDFRRWLAEVDARTISVQDLTSFVDFCHSLAVVAVRHRIPLRMMQDRVGLWTDADIAIDCIADLFRRDGAGVVVQIKAYFEGIPWRDMPDEELLTHIRRLVFSRVNQGLFRILSESDPSLGKILRNIKLAVQALNNYVLIERFGKACLHPASCPTLEHLPVLSREDLHSALGRIANGSENIPTLLARFSLFLREQEECSRIVPFVTLGLAFRDLYDGGKELPDQSASMDHLFEEEDAVAIVRASCRSVHREMIGRYVEKDKIDQVLYDRYFAVIEKNLIHRYVVADGEKVSLFQTLKEHDPDLSGADYVRHHRSRVEYLARLTDRRVRQALKGNS